MALDGWTKVDEISEASSEAPSAIKGWDRVDSESPSTVFNTGNIRASSNSFRKYGSYADGIDDQQSLLLSYQDKHGLNTIRGVINRWAPPEDNNDTSGYVQYMSKALGIDPDTPIDLHDPKLLGDFSYAQAKMEKGADKLKVGRETFNVIADVHHNLRANQSQAQPFTGWTKVDDTDNGDVLATQARIPYGPTLQEDVMGKPPGVGPNEAKVGTADVEARLFQDSPQDTSYMTPSEALREGWSIPTSAFVNTVSGLQNLSDKVNPMATMLAAATGKNLEPMPDANDLGIAPKTAGGQVFSEVLPYFAAPELGIEGIAAGALDNSLLRFGARAVNRVIEQSPSNLLGSVASAPKEPEKQLENFLLGSSVSALIPMSSAQNATQRALQDTTQAGTVHSVSGLGYIVDNMNKLVGQNIFGESEMFRLASDKNALIKGYRELGLPLPVGESNPIVKGTAKVTGVSDVKSFELKDVYQKTASNSTNPELTEYWTKLAVGDEVGAKTYLDSLKAELSEPLEDWVSEWERTQKLDELQVAEATTKRLKLLKSKKTTAEQMKDVITGQAIKHGSRLATGAALGHLAFPGVGAVVGALASEPLALLAKNTAGRVLQARDIARLKRFSTAFKGGYYTPSATEDLINVGRQSLTNYGKSRSNQ